MASSQTQRLVSQTYEVQPLDVIIFMVGNGLRGDANHIERALHNREERSHTIERNASRMNIDSAFARDLIHGRGHDIVGEWILEQRAVIEVPVIEMSDSAIPIIRVGMVDELSDDALGFPMQIRVILFSI